MEKSLILGLKEDLDKIYCAQFDALPGQSPEFESTFQGPMIKLYYPLFTAILIEETTFLATIRFASSRGSVFNVEEQDHLVLMRVRLETRAFDRGQQCRCF